jgi:DNA-directed RNA polymerase subunit N (RpoN/RPB10)
LFLRKADDVCIRVSHKGCQDIRPCRRSLQHDDPCPTSRQQSAKARKERHPSPNRASTLSQLIYHSFALNLPSSNNLLLSRRSFDGSILLLFTTTLQFVFPRKIVTHFTPRSLNRSINMRFDVAFVFAILGAAVEALPLTGSNVSTLPVIILVNKATPCHLRSPRKTNNPTRLISRLPTPPQKNANSPKPQQPPKTTTSSQSPNLKAQPTTTSVTAGSPRPTTTTTSSSADNSPKALARPPLTKAATPSRLPTPRARPEIRKGSDGNQSPAASCGDRILRWLGMGRMRLSCPSRRARPEIGLGSAGVGRDCCRRIFFSQVLKGEDGPVKMLKSGKFSFEFNRMSCVSMYLSICIYLSLPRGIINL